MPKGYSESQDRKRAAAFAGAEARFWSYVDREAASGCWLWTGAVDNNGYGQFNYRPALEGPRRVVKAYILAWELLRGERHGLVLDHLCHTSSDCVGGLSCAHRRCVNPEHLELVTQAENARRGADNSRVALRAKWADRTHCSNGHPWIAENLRRYGRRTRCVRCEEIQRADRKQTREVVPA